MVSPRMVKEQLRQTKIMTVLSEKRTILSELRTWVTLILLPISIITAAIAIIKTNNITGSIIFRSMIIISVLFVAAILYFITKNFQQLFNLNKKIKEIGPP